MKLSLVPVTIGFYLFLFKIVETNSAKILGISWYPAVSHGAFFNAIWKELSLRGHQVTIITPMPIKDDTLKNLTEIDVSFLSDVRKKKSSVEIFSKNRYVWQLVKSLKLFLLELLEAMLASNEVQTLIRSLKTFDVIVAEVHSPLVFAFGERFKAPVVGLSSTTAPLEIYDFYANPTHPLISPDYIIPMETSPNDHPFSARVASFLYNIWYRMFNYWYFLPESDKIAKKYFGTNFPYLEDICRKYSSILLTNVNILTNPVRANVPTVIEVNQIHIRENRSLPKDLQNFLDSSSQGAVYFSLGTHVLDDDVNNETLNEIIQAFGELSFKILFKWNKEKLPALPANVMVNNFFPQQDILAHPNVKVFVTQGGMQSIEEAIFKGVPMVGIPFLGDQPLNVKRLVDMGLAVRLKPSEITKDSLKKAIMEITKNKRYKETVRKYKSIMEDQPLRGIDKVIWWIEYVIRHKGAEHLRSPAVDMSYFKYFMLDVISFLLVIIFGIYYVLYKLFIPIRRNHEIKSKEE